uniref:Caspase recruitment domain-containing protein n=1 Tax=Trichobilharzia regenti TaxID=157069 RepID=A0AA85IWR9_TRIRE|nr:unnamed protein product [Trichobilharzia regenti]
MVFIVMLSNEEQAVMRNLPALVADLESMDIIDHLTATTPPSITPADYESIIATSQREGRRAGVRCLVACLLRRTDSSKVFQSFINILKEDYRHLSDLLSSTYESLKGSNEKDESDFGTTASSISLHSDAVVKANDPTGIITPCQLDLDILSMIPYLILSPSYVPSDCNYKLEKKSWWHGSVGGSPFKRLQSVNSTTTVKLNHQFIRKLVVEQLIPALQRLNLWNLANRIHREIVQCSGGDGDAGDGSVGGDKQDLLCCSTIDSNKKCSLLCVNDPSLMKSISNANHHDHDQNHFYFSSCNILKAYPQLNYAKSLLFSCVEPLFHHSLILLDWPFLLHELHVCSTCISYLIMCCSTSSRNRSTMCHYHNDNNNSNNLIASSNCNAASSYQTLGASTTTNQNDDDGDGDNDDEKIRNSALKIYFNTVLHNTLLQRMITEKNDNNSCQSSNPIGHIFNESVQKSCVASVIHTQLLPGLRSLDLNVLHDEIEQLAYKMLH